MAYRKFSADHLFTGFEMLSENSVLITDGKGKIHDIVSRDAAGEDIQQLNGIISPGFINCHCHLELSHLRGLVPEGIGMIPFLLTVMGKRSIDAGEIASAIGEAERDMINSGIVAVGDICNTGDTVLQKQQHNIYYHNFIEATGFVEATAPSRFRQALDIYDAFGPEATIVPHAPYSVSGNLLGMINDHKKGSLLSIHNQESHAENELFEQGSGDFLKLYESLGIDISSFKKTGKTSIQSYMGKISSDHSLLLVHNTVTGKADMEWLMKNQHALPALYWCICLMPTCILMICWPMCRC